MEGIYVPEMGLLVCWVVVVEMQQVSEDEIDEFAGKVWWWWCK